MGCNALTKATTGKAFWNSINNIVHHLVSLLVFRFPIPNLYVTSLYYYSQDHQSITLHFHPFSLQLTTYLNLMGACIELCSSSWCWSPNSVTVHHMGQGDVVMQQVLDVKHWANICWIFTSNNFVSIALLARSSVALLKNSTRYSGNVKSLTEFT